MNINKVLEIRLKFSQEKDFARWSCQIHRKVANIVIRPKNMNTF